MQIKECPFCGGEAEVIQDTQEEWFYVRCKNCWAKTDGCATPEDAIKFWNARKCYEKICKNLRRILPFIQDGEAKNELYEMLEEIEDQKQTGKWMQCEEDTYECSVCGLRLSIEGAKPNFCPHCGARNVAR